MKQSRIYDMQGVSLDLSILATVGCIRIVENQYKFDWVVNDGERTKWTTTYDSKAEAEMHRRNLIQAWKSYYDERENIEKTEPKQEQEKAQEEVRVDPIESLSLEDSNENNH